MHAYDSIAGRIVRKKKKLFGGWCMAISDGQREVTVDIALIQYERFSVGDEITIGFMGRQIVNIRPGIRAGEESEPEADPWRTPGKPVYTCSSRLRRNEEAELWACTGLDRDEIITFDHDLCEHMPADPLALEPPGPDRQYLAVVVAPSPVPDAVLEADGRFEPAGYDLVEESTGISAITNCGRGFEDVIDYDALNAFGLIGTYQDARKVQKALVKAYPEEPHADCDIVAIWRFVEK